MRIWLVLGVCYGIAGAHDPSATREEEHRPAPSASPPPRARLRAAAGSVPAPTTTPWAPPDGTTSSSWHTRLAFTLPGRCERASAFPPRAARPPRAPAARRQPRAGSGAGRGAGAAPPTWPSSPSSTSPTSPRHWERARRAARRWGPCSAASRRPPTTATRRWRPSCSAGSSTPRRPPRSSRPCEPRWAASCRYPCGWGLGGAPGLGTGLLGGFPWGGAGDRG